MSEGSDRPATPEWRHDETKRPFENKKVPYEEDKAMDDSDSDDGDGDWEPTEEKSY